MIEITEAPVARTESPYISAYEAFVIEDKQSKRIIRYYKKVRSDEYYDWYVTINPMAALDWFGSLINTKKLKSLVLVKNIAPEK